MATDTLDRTARAAVAAACEAVSEPSAEDAVDGVAPGLVVRPSSTEQVAAVMRATAAHGLSVVPRGRGTKLSWGTAPTSADVLLDLGSLDQVLDHQAGDLIVAAQAGARLSDVQDVVRRGDQRLAIDETVPGASVGGTLAANTSGCRRVAVGSARDLLIGITVVRADGVVAKAGGRVVKNVAGYDLGKLLIGSFGTLAVIVDATFRLHPLPVAHRWVSVEVDEPGAAHAAVQSVIHAQAVPSAIEVDWAGGRGTVSVLLEGREDGVAGRAETVRGLLGEASTEGTEEPAGGAAYPWELGVAGDERATALKLTFALSGLSSVLLAADGAGVRLRGSAGAGVVYGVVEPGASVEHVRDAVERLRRTCTQHGGAAVVLDAPARVKEALDVWGPIPALDLMWRVKDQFDPDHRLAPGRFVGGI